MEDEKEIEQQAIVKEYFEKQENSKLKLCIYEEKASKDVEWFFFNNEWCYLKVKKETITDFDGEKSKEDYFYIESKRFKTFGKKCHIETMSYDYFMALDYMNERNTDTVSVETAHEYANKFIKLKKEKEKQNITFTLDDYHEYIEQERKNFQEQQAKGCRDFILWCITIFLVITLVGIPIAIFTCPLTWKLINKLRGKQ